MPRSPPLLVNSSENGAQEALDDGGSRSYSLEELSRQSTTIPCLLVDQCKHGQFPRPSRLLSRLIHVIAGGPECHNRTTIQIHDWESQWSSARAIMFLGLDRYAEQAQACAGGGSRRYQHRVQQRAAGGLDRGIGHNICKTCWSRRGAEGRC